MAEQKQIYELDAIGSVLSTNVLPISLASSGDAKKASISELDTYFSASTATLTNKTLTSPVINSPTGIVKGDVGLGNVDNTSDANKPVSTATQTALDLKANDNAVVKLTGDQTVDGIKTFSSSPIVPAPTTDLQAATKKYVDDNAGTGDVTAASAFGTDNRIIRSDGTGKGVQSSGISIDDSDNITGINNVTGLDTNLVTGTAGTNGNLASWNTDGDVVDFSMATNRILGRNTAGSGVVEELTGSTVRDLISLGTSDSPQFAGINLGHATDTTITRDSAGVIAVEGVVIPSISSTDTLTNKTINLTNNTLSGTTAQFNTALSDGSFATLAGTETLTNKTLTSPVISSISNTGTLTLPTSTDTLVGRSTTDTLTNKRVTPRVGTTASSATPTINTDNVDMYILTAQAADITSFTTNLSGTPTNGQKLWIAITGTAARAITRGASFENGAVDLPTTTITTQRLDVGFVWNAATSKRRCMAAGPLS